MKEEIALDVYQPEHRVGFDSVRRETPECAAITRSVTYLMIVALIVVFSWMTERDDHPFNEQEVKVRS